MTPNALLLMGLITSCNEANVNVQKRFYEFYINVLRFQFYEIFVFTKSIFGAS